MKVLRKWSFVLIALLLALSLSVFTACDNGDNDSDKDDDTIQDDGDEEDEEPSAGETAYVFEAEYTYVIGLEGLGPSGSPSGLGLIGESATASNGFFVGSLGASSPITFTITSDKEVTVTLKGVVGSNALGTCKWNPTTFEILVNDVAVQYDEFSTELGLSDTQNFKTKTIGEITLKEGENTIVFHAGDNKYLNNLASAPSIDCIKITTDATLTMETYESNLE